jgi:hypothetical protein
MPNHHSYVFSGPHDRNLDGRRSDIVRRPTHLSAAEVTYKHTSFEERRRHPRSPLKLHGRYMLSDGSEFPCETVNVFPGGIAIRGLKGGSPAERVVVYIEDLGRMEGGILRSVADWFAIEIHAPAKKQERLAEKIAWLVKSEDEGLADRRIRRRIEVAHEPIPMRTLDGRAFDVKLIDVSNTGAALLVDVVLPIGARVILDDKPASVSRRFPGGVAIAFREAAPERVREILTLAEEEVWSKSGPVP